MEFCGKFFGQKMGGGGAKKIPGNRKICPKALKKAKNISYLLGFLKNHQFLIL
jgi:hypothetical protein